MIESNITKVSKIVNKLIDSKNEGSLVNLSYDFHVPSNNYFKI